MVVSSVTPADALGDARVPAGLLGKPLLDRGEEHFLLLVGRAGDDRAVGLRLHAEVEEQRGVAAVVEDHVGEAAVVPLEDAVAVVPVVLQALALVGEDRRAAGGDRRGGVVLGRIDVARGPAHLGAERLQRLDQDGGLDRHVQRAGDARAAQRLLGAELLAGLHQAGHLGLGQRDFLASPVGEADVLDDVIVEFRHSGLLGRRRMFALPRVIAARRARAIRI